MNAYEQRQVSADLVLEKAEKAASIHAKYRRFNRAIELYSTCEKFLDGLIDSGKGLSVLDDYLPIYIEKAEILLQKG